MAGLSENHAAYMEGRALDVEVAARMGVQSHGREIAYPYKLDGQLLYSKMIEPHTKRMRCEPSGMPQRTLWNEDCLRDEPKPDQALIITEGENDALAVMGTGEQFVVSLPSGAANSESGCRSKAIKALCVPNGDDRAAPELKPEIAKFRKVIVAVDCDHDGVLMRDVITELIGKEYCWVPTYPAGSKDANDVAKEHGINKLAAVIADARPAVSDGYIGFLDIRDTIERVEPRFCGLPWLEPHFRPTLPGLITIGGMANHGKTTLYQTLLFNLLWANPDLKASVFHAEGCKFTPGDNARLFWKGQFGAKPWTPGVTDKERDAWVNDRLGFIRPPQGQMATFDWLMWSMERQVLHRKRKVFVLDCWNKIIHEGRGNASETDYTQKCLAILNDFILEHRVMVIVVHHVRKPVSEQIPPSKYDLSGSQHWANASDFVMMIWKPDNQKNESRIDVVKTKDYAFYGTPGSVWVKLIEPKKGSGATFKPWSYGLEPLGCVPERWKSVE